MSDCCTQLKSADEGAGIPRRTLLTGAAAIAGAAATMGASEARADDSKPIKLAFCSQLLCIIPYTVALSQGYFKKEGLNVQLVYSKGGNDAMQALVGGAVDYGATSLDVAIQAYAHGAKIRRFASTGKLPLFALAVAPKSAGAINDVKDLEGKTVGVSALGNADHALALYLLKQANADASKVKFANMGTNLFEALRQGAIDAGMVQEPALTLVVKSGGKVLVNAMMSADAQKYLGGNYEFMGVAVRADEFDARRAQMTALTKALAGALVAVQSATPDELVASLPPEMTTGADTGEMKDILAKYRSSLYPTMVSIDKSAADRVTQTLRVGGLLPADAQVSGLFDYSFAG